MSHLIKIFFCGILIVTSFLLEASPFSQFPRHKNYRARYIKPKPKTTVLPTSYTKPAFLILKVPVYNPGFFSVFTSIFGFLHSYDETKYSGMKVYLDTGRYLDPLVGPNWWEYFFEPLSIGSELSAPLSYFNDNDFNNYGWWPIYHMSRERGYELIKKYLRIKPHIQQKTDSFQERNFGDDFIIGVHYRGTDKIAEARRIPYEEVKSAIQKAIDNLPQPYINAYKIFVATDEQAFLDFIKMEFSCPILYIDSLRSINGQPVHDTLYTSNYQRGEDAIIDCILLSKCNRLVRTVSNLSFWAERFNPFMPVDVLQ